MQLSTHVEALLADATEIAAVGDETTAEAARRLTNALRPAAGLRLQDALTEATLELSAQLPSGHVEVRLAGQDLSLVYVDEGTAAHAPSDEGLTARITLRLPEGLKAGIEAAAAREALSVNAWIVRALTRSAGGTTTRNVPGSRLTGFARG